MKVLFIADHLKYGGTEQVLIDVLGHFDENKYDVSLCLLDDELELLSCVPSYVSVIKYDHFPLFKLVKKVCRRFNAIRIYLFLERMAFKRFMSDKKFDIVISWKEGEAVLFHSFIFERANQKNITWLHTNLKLNHWTMFWCYGNQIALEHNIYKNKHLSNIVFVSHGQKTSFNSLYSDICHAQSVVYNLIDKERIEEKSTEFEVTKHRYTICCIGRLSKEKRIDKAILAAKELKERGCDFELWIIGNGYCYEELMAMISDFKLADCIKMLGYQRNPYPYLRSADMLLLTSDTESFSLVVVEALCLSKPVISTATLGPVELLEDKYGIITGFEVADIANAVQELMSDEDKMANLSLLAKQRAGILSDPDKTMQQIYDLFQ